MNQEDDRLIQPAVLAAWVAQAEQVRQQRAVEHCRQAEAIRAGADRGRNQEQPAGRRA